MDIGGKLLTYQNICGKIKTIFKMLDMVLTAVKLSKFIFTVATPYRHDNDSGKRTYSNFSGVTHRGLTSTNYKKKRRKEMKLKFIKQWQFEF